MPHQNTGCAHFLSDPKEQSRAPPLPLHSFWAPRTFPNIDGWRSWPREWPSWHMSTHWFQQPLITLPFFSPCKPTAGLFLLRAAVVRYPLMFGLYSLIGLCYFEWADESQISRSAESAFLLIHVRSQHSVYNRQIIRFWHPAGRLCWRGGKEKKTGYILNVEYFRHSWNGIMKKWDHTLPVWKWITALLIAKNSKMPGRFSFI